MRNLASALFLTEREFIPDPSDPKRKPPKVKGRIITTIQKAKEVRPLVERSITVALRGREAEEASRPFGTTAERNSEAWKAWREGPEWLKWNQAIAPMVKARRRLLQMLGDKEAAHVLYYDVAPRFVGRTQGGYTRIMRLAKPRLGDSGTRAVLEFVGVRDRVRQRAQAPKVETA